MSGQSLWNPAAKLDKAERPDMSSLGSDISSQSLCNSAMGRICLARQEFLVVG
jgi:hypothetical protein